MAVELFFLFFKKKFVSIEMLTEKIKSYLFVDCNKNTRLHV